MILKSWKEATQMNKTVGKCGKWAQVGPRRFANRLEKEKKEHVSFWYENCRSCLQFLQEVVSGCGRTHGSVSPAGRHTQRSDCKTDEGLPVEESKEAPRKVQQIIKGTWSGEEGFNWAWHHVSSLQIVNTPREPSPGSLMWGKDRSNDDKRRVFAVCAEWTGSV